jgi:hypothetical protein
VAATNSDLEAEIKAGHFRDDLYYRLAVLQIRVPALRERPEDIPLLAERFAAEVASRLGREAPAVGPETAARLKSYSWPGNVRELQNVIERALILNPRHRPGGRRLPTERARERGGPQPARRLEPAREGATDGSTAPGQGGAQGGRAAPGHRSPKPQLLPAQARPRRRRGHLLRVVFPCASKSDLVSSCLFADIRPGWWRPLRPRSCDRGFGTPALRTGEASTARGEGPRRPHLFFRVRFSHTSTQAFVGWPSTWKFPVTMSMSPSPSMSATSREAW